MEPPDQPKVIDYAAGQFPRNPLRPSKEIRGLWALILTLVFFFSANVIENRTSHFLSALGDSYAQPRAGWRGRLPSGERQDRALLMEAVWSFPATVCFVCAIAIFSPRKAALRLRAVAAAIVGALAYSWVRWLVSLSGFRSGEGDDFLLAMLLAASAGLVAGAVWRDTINAESKAGLQTDRSPPVRQD